MNTASKFIKAKLICLDTYVRKMFVWNIYYNFIFFEQKEQ